MSGSVGAEEEIPKSALPQVDLAAVEKATRGTAEELRTALKHVRAADLGRELSRFTHAESRRVLDALDDRQASAMLRAAHPKVAADLLAMIEPARAARLLDFLPMDERASLTRKLPDDARAKIEAVLDPEIREQLARVNAHPEGSVGRLMTPKAWQCQLGHKVQDALGILRERASDIDAAANCYVLDGGKLVGVAPLRQLAISPPDALVRDLMTTDVISVLEDSDRAGAAEIIVAHNFLSLPVVDTERRLKGVVTVDDLLETAVAKVGTGFLNQGGVAGKIVAAAPYFQNPIARVVRSRLTWLVLLFVAETATGTVLRQFEETLARWVQLAFFIPLLIGTGGNAGSQTVSTVIRALALGEVRLRDVLRVIGREVTAGLILGILLGAIAFGRARMWGCDNYIATCVSLTIIVVCTWANCVGAAIPIGAQRAGVDPTVISGPLITTLVDASGLFIYLTIAVALLTNRPAPRSELVGTWEITARTSSSLDLREDGSFTLDAQKGTWTREGTDIVLDLPEGKFKYRVTLEGKEGKPPEKMVLGAEGVSATLVPQEKGAVGPPPPRDPISKAMRTK